jgi:FkbM family methyltransferase
MNTATFKMPCGYSIEVHQDSKLIIDEIWEDKFYDKDFFIEKGMTVLDIGANQGVFTLYAASKGANVHSYEPAPQNYSLLKKNVIENKLENFVTTHQKAIAGTAGTIELYIPVCDKYVTNGLITTSKIVIDDLSQKLQSDSSKVIVESVSLPEVLNRINSNEIDLLKIDCEGAEFEILKAITKKEISKVRNIVMETHIGYSEKELFFLLINLGFKILRYEKVGEKNAGLFKTGYLFCVREDLPGSEIKTIVSVIKTENFAIMNKDFFIDASESFFSASKNDNLIMDVFINNSHCVSSSTASIIKCEFKKTGINKISFKESCNGESITEEKFIYCFENGYFESKSDYIMPSPGEKIKIEFCGNCCFKVDTSQMPVGYAPFDINIGVVFPEGVLPAGIYSFNGEMFDLEKPYQSFLIKDFTNITPLFFNVNIPEGKEAEVFWWSEEKQNKEIDIPAELYEKYVVLKPYGQTLQLEHSNVNEYLVHTCMLPVDWKPKKIFFGVGPLEHGEAMEGEITINGVHYPLNKWYTEINMNFTGLQNYTISINDKISPRKMKIAWWPC